MIRRRAVRNRTPASFPLHGTRAIPPLTFRRTPNSDVYSARLVNLTDKSVVYAKQTRRRGGFRLMRSKPVIGPIEVEEGWNGNCTKYSKGGSSVSKVGGLFERSGGAMKAFRLMAGLAISLALFCSTPTNAQQPAWKWYEVDAHRNVTVNVFVFWSASCPHCAEALRFVDEVQGRHGWLRVYRYEISQNAANRQFYEQMAASIQRPAGQTPAFFFGAKLEIGYTSYEQTGKRMESTLVRWHEALERHFRQTPSAASDFAGTFTLLTAIEDQPATPALPPELPVDLPTEDEFVLVPGWGQVDANKLSLPALTLVIAGCDAFNPCAFFVLMLLLSLLVHSQSRVRMLVVGGVYVFFSGLMYFLFMAAWLNLFFVIGHMTIFTAAAGVLAVVIGLVNVKDYFWFKQGPSLSIPETAKPGLFQRMTKLINVSSMPSLVAGAAVLAVVANLYELLCTSGFPMVYTRVLTLRQLPNAGYYAYLFLYNVIYVAPMAVIVLAFTATLGARKLTEAQGRTLKLLSGAMMLALGLILMFRPNLLNTIVGAVGLLATSIGATAVIAGLSKGRSVWTSGTRGSSEPADR